MSAVLGRAAFVVHLDWASEVLVCARKYARIRGFRPRVKEFP